MTPMRAIRLRCLDCCCGSAVEVKRCPCPDCPLYQYRLGKNPKRAGLGGNIASLRSKPGSTRDSRARTVPADLGAVPTSDAASDAILCDVKAPDR